MRQRLGLGGGALRPVGRMAGAKDCEDCGRQGSASEGDRQRRFLEMPRDLEGEGEAEQDGGSDHEKKRLSCGSQADLARHGPPLPLYRRPRETRITPPSRLSPTATRPARVPRVEHWKKLGGAPRTQEHAGRWTPETARRVR